MECGHRGKFCTTCLLLVLAFIAVCPDLASSAAMGASDYPFSRSSQFGTVPWYATRWGQYLIAAFLGGLFGSFFSQRFKKIRQWIFLGFLALGALFGTLAYPFLGNLVVFVVAAGLAYYNPQLHSQLSNHLQSPHSSILTC